MKYSDDQFRYNFQGLEYTVVFIYTTSDKKIISFNIIDGEIDVTRHVGALAIIEMARVARDRILYNLSEAR